MLRCMILCFFLYNIMAEQPLPYRLEAIATLHLNRLHCIVAAFRSRRIPIRSIILTAIKAHSSLACYVVFRVMFRHVSHCYYNIKL